MESYSAQTIESWKRAIAPYARKAPVVDPVCSALLVIDMQQHFAGICEPIVATVRHAVGTCRDAGVPVVFTQHGHADPRADGGMLYNWWGELIVEGTPDHRMLDGIGLQPEDRVIPKRRYDAFFGTELHQTLQELGVCDLAIAGVMTNLCVETTARAAFVHDYHVRLLMDAVATTTEEMQIASLVNLSFGFAHVQTADEWQRKLSGPRP